MFSEKVPDFGGESFDGRSFQGPTGVGIEPVAQWQVGKASAGARAPATEVQQATGVVSVDVYTMVPAESE